MNLSEAKKVIASYLTGQKVSREDVREACQVVKSDEDYVRYLKEEFGMHDEWISECEIFLARVAEFSEMTEQEREDEMPELCDHITECASCREEFWDIRPLWIRGAITDIKTRTAEISKRLAEHIRLVIDETGRLIEQGIAPPTIERAFIFSRLSASPEESTDKEWELGDEESDCSIKLAVACVESGGVNLTCDIESDVTFDAERARIEVRGSETDALHLAGRLSDFRSAPIFLPLGSWTIKIQADIGGKLHNWNIPLQLRGEKS